MAIMCGMYDASLLHSVMMKKFGNFNLLGKAAGVDRKTAKSIVLTGWGRPESVLRVTRALGFAVKQYPDRDREFDLIVRRNGIHHASSSTESISKKKRKKAA